MISAETKIIAIRDVTHVGGYKLRMEFADGKKRVVDFEPFLAASQNPAIRDFLQVEKFESFRLEHGDLIWGDFELCFPIADLYRGKI